MTKTAAAPRWGSGLVITNQFNSAVNRLFSCRTRDSIFFSQRSLYKRPTTSPMQPFSSPSWLPGAAPFFTLRRAYLPAKLNLQSSRLVPASYAKGNAVAVVVAAFPHHVTRRESLVSPAFCKSVASLVKPIRRRISGDKRSQHVILLLLRKFIALQPKTRDICLLLDLLVTERMCRRAAHELADFDSAVFFARITLPEHQ